MADVGTDISSPGDRKMFNASVQQEKGKKRFDVDSGRAWVVLASIFFLLALMQGYQRSNGLVFLEIEDKYWVSASSASLIGGVCSLAFAISVIFVMTFVLEVMSVRKTVLIGVTLMSSAILIASTMTSYPGLLLTLGVMVGVGVSFIYGPTFVLLGNYFDKRLTLATAVANTGVSVGSFVMPFVLRVLLDEFALSGGLLVASGVLSNQFVCACLLRSSPAFRPGAESKPRGPDDGWSKGETVDKTSEPLLGVIREMQIDSEEESILPASGYKNTGQLSAANMPDETRPCDTVHVKENSVQTHLSCSEILPSEPESQTGDKRWRQESLAGHSDDLVPAEETDSAHVETRYEHMETRSGHLETRSEPVQTVTIPDLSSAVIFDDNLSPSSKFSFRVLVNEPKHLAGKSVCSLRDAKDDVLRDRDASREKVSRCLSSARRKLSQRFDVTVLSSLPFWVLVFFQWFGISLGNLGPIFLPPLALEMGFSEREATFMLMLNGGFDILSRILPGVIADYKLLQPHQMVITVQVIVGILCQFTFLFDTYSAMAAFSVTLGALGGVIFSMTQIMIIDFMGLDRFPVTFGFIQLFNATSSAVGFPLVGYLKDTTGTYTTSFHYLGATQLVSSAILVSFLLLGRCQQWRERAEG